MQFGPYTFKNFRSFRGSKSLSFNIYRNGHRFAYYTNDGNGGCGSVLPYPEKPKDSTQEEWEIIREFEAYAPAHTPRHIDSPEFGLSEHDSDVDYFAAAIASWADIEKLSRTHKKMGFGYTAVLLDNKVFPATAFPIKDNPDWDKTERIFNHYAVKKTLACPSFTIIPAGDVVFYDSFPEGNPFKE